jgi:hypothetical protein
LDVLGGGGDVEEGAGAEGVGQGVIEVAQVVEDLAFGWEGKMRSERVVGWNPITFVRPGEARRMAGKGGRLVYIRVYIRSDRTLEATRAASSRCLKSSSS